MLFESSISHGTFSNIFNTQVYQHVTYCTFFVETCRNMTPFRRFELSVGDQKCRATLFAPGNSCAQSVGGSEGRSQRQGLGCERRRRVWRVRHLGGRARGRSQTDPVLQAWRNPSCQPSAQRKLCETVPAATLPASDHRSGLDQAACPCTAHVKPNPCGASTRHASRPATSTPSSDEMNAFATLWTC